jgi:DNA polymerase I
MIARGENVGIGTFVDYYIGEGNSKKIGDRVYLSDENVKYDVEYYLKKQILPAVEGIFDVFGVDIGAEIEGERQETLF